MTLTPLHDRVVVRRLDSKEKSAGGIIIPDNAREKQTEGEVVAVGPGSRGEDGQRMPVGVVVGDRVLFGKYGGTEVRVDGEDLLIVNELDILGVVANKPARRKSA